MFFNLRRILKSMKKSNYVSESSLSFHSSSAGHDDTRIDIVLYQSFSAWLLVNDNPQLGVYLLISEARKPSQSSACQNTLARKRKPVSLFFSRVRNLANRSPSFCVFQIKHEGVDAYSFHSMALGLNFSHNFRNIEAWNFIGQNKFVKYKFLI